MANRTSLTVLQLNDSHAYFDLHQEMFWQGGQGLSTCGRICPHCHTRKANPGCEPGACAPSTARCTQNYGAR